MIDGYNFFMQLLVNIPRANEEEDWQHTSIFQTCATCQGRLCTTIIGGGSTFNIVLQEPVDKLNLKSKKHPNP